jgi:hypothetical protein
VFAPELWYSGIIGCFHSMDLGSNPGTSDLSDKGNQLVL